MIYYYYCSAKQVPLNGFEVSPICLGDNHKLTQLQTFSGLANLSFLWLQLLGYLSRYRPFSTHCWLQIITRFFTWQYKRLFLSDFKKKDSQIFCDFFCFDQVDWGLIQFCIQYCSRLVGNSSDSYWFRSVELSLNCLQHRQLIFAHPSHQMRESAKTTKFFIKKLPRHDCVTLGAIYGLLQRPPSVWRYRFASCLFDALV